VPGFSGFASCWARLYRLDRAGQWFCCAAQNGLLVGKGWHWILRRQGRSGKGRWVGRLVVFLLVLLVFWLLLIFLGRPIEPRMIEVDVTDKIADSATPESRPQ